MPALAKRNGPGRDFVHLDVAHLASGMDLRLGLHVVTGAKPGPTLGILTTVHGDETMSMMAVRQLLAGLDVGALAGRVAAIPVANPLAVSVFNRQTPEQHGKTDLHEVFPGSPDGNLTQRMANVITTHLLDHVDALIDIHCGGLGRPAAGARRSRRVGGPRRSIRPRSSSVAPSTRPSCTPTISPARRRYCAIRALGIPTANPEIGGVYLGPQAETAYIEETVAGLRSMMASLGMIAGAGTPTKKQLLFGVKSRFESNPSVGGFLQSHFASPSDLGRRIEKGTLLGEVVDPHGLEVIDELRAPVTGFLFFSRYSGMVDAGTKAFALAEEATSQWL